MNRHHSLSQATARSRGLAARRALGAAPRSDASSAIASTLVGLGRFSAARTVAGYWPTTHEVDLVTLWVHLDLAGVQVCLPRIDPSATASMHFVRWDPAAEMTKNRYGIPEPQGSVVRLDALDVIVLPCSAVDDDGTRVGMGAGFYDRALSEFVGIAPCRHSSDRVLLIGVAFECQRVPSDTRIVRRDWDVGVDVVVTESVTVVPSR